MSSASTQCYLAGYRSIPDEIFALEQYTHAKERMPFLVATCCMPVAGLVLNEYFGPTFPFRVAFSFTALLYGAALGWTCNVLRSDAQGAVEGKKIVDSLRPVLQLRIKNQKELTKNFIEQKTKIPGIETLFEEIFTYRILRNSVSKGDTVKLLFFDEEDSGPVKISPKIRLICRDKEILFPKPSQAPRVEKVYFGSISRSVYLSKIALVGDKYQAIWKQAFSLSPFATKAEFATDLSLHDFARVLSGRRPKQN